MANEPKLKPLQSKLINILGLNPVSHFSVFYLFKIETTIHI